MDPEQQPLLSENQNPEIRYRAIRHLSYHEVQLVRQDPTWRRARLIILFTFWAIMAMSISLIVCMVTQASRCDKLDHKAMPTVAPVHMTMASLAWRGVDGTPPYS